MNESHVSSKSLSTRWYFYLGWSIEIFNFVSKKPRAVSYIGSYSLDAERCILVMMTHSLQHNFLFKIAQVMCFWNALINNDEQSLRVLLLLLLPSPSLSSSQVLCCHAKKWDLVYGILSHRYKLKSRRCLPSLLKWSFRWNTLVLNLAPSFKTLSRAKMFFRLFCQCWLFCFT